MKAPILDRIYTGEAAGSLRRWPDSFIDLAFSSPPYFQLRDYGVAGQLGREDAPEAYVEGLLVVVREIRRVLADRGSFYLNVGDTYRGKSLLGIPWRVALAMTAEGWLLRNAIIWHKPYGLPSSIKDRLTSRYEFIFHFTKTADYYYDLDAIRTPHKGPHRDRIRTRRLPSGGPQLPHRPGVPVPGNYRPHPLGKNPGDVWTIGPETRPKRYIVPGETTAHYAPFPETLVEPAIKAACPVGGIVLDPFIGSGTTAVVARRLGRHFLGIELSAEYARLARRRLAYTRPHTPRCSTPSFNPRSSLRTASTLPCSKDASGSAPSFSSRQQDDS